MHKHVLWFDTIAERDNAEAWIKANFEMEDDEALSLSTQYSFYTSTLLTERQQEIIVSTVKPTSYSMNEEM